MPSVLDFIDNPGIDLRQAAVFAAILGVTPSRGARSPQLWNAAFAKLGIDGIMHPMDVSPANLQEVVKQLRADVRFIGGAVTMPYKRDIIPFLDRLEPEAEIIGAVNCIYRNEGELVGTNTDGAGALASLEEAYGGPIAGKSVVLLGVGGAGLAVAAYLATALGSQGRLQVANRSAGTLQEAVTRLKKLACRITSLSTWPVRGEDIEQTDLVINCTSVGFSIIHKNDRGALPLRFFSPLGEIDETTARVQDAIADKGWSPCVAAILPAIQKNYGQSLAALAAWGAPFVFDIIYQPLNTMLLSQGQLLGARTLNGLAMNLEQAVIAFDKATTRGGLRSSNPGEVRSIMAQVK